MFAKIRTFWSWLTSRFTAKSRAAYAEKKAAEKAETPESSEDKKAEEKPGFFGKIWNNITSVAGNIWGYVTDVVVSTKDWVVAPKSWWGKTLRAITSPAIIILEAICAVTGITAFVAFEGTDYIKSIGSEKGNA